MFEAAQATWAPSPGPLVHPAIVEQKLPQTIRTQPGAAVPIKLVLQNRPAGFDLRAVAGCLLISINSGHLKGTASKLHCVYSGKKSHIL